MKAIIIFSLLVAISVSTSSQYPIEDLICPDLNPDNCYPKIFKPSNEWQTIKEGQEIPAGLHIRVNVDTLLKEAKLIDNSENLEISSSENAAVVIVDQDQTQEQDIKDNNNQRKMGSYSHKPNSKIPLEEKNEFTESIDTLSNLLSLSPDSTFSKENIFTSLDTLIELSHDIDFGITLSTFKNFQTLLYLSGLSPIKSDLSRLTERLNEQEIFELKEKSLRIIGSTLRNNPIALANFLNNDQDQKPGVVVKNIFEKLKSNDNNIINNRMLSILDILTETQDGENYINLTDGKAKLLAQYIHFPKDSQLKILQILENMEQRRALNKRNEEQKNIKDLTEDEVTVKYSNFLKGMLSDDPNNSNFKQIFMNLVQLKKDKNKLVKVDSDFLNWLTDEIKRRKTDPVLVKMDNDDLKDKNSERFDQYMLKARHEVFGNPMGLRKALVDEL
ncbi:hypothetical protein PACTADRAFT_50760 [Pachysolen tannophilus NRRL Y-2460]|uniref:Nucleotide exchange factor SIL1 n=1 Tax=Pachysolen tannophilus NRRL Y-2460 TaxID=669874 RepID=A0A1E4TT10_PACTA|nr:hypothetical protein PACTADRAFT_50760 [Pachysolen tannophilus NRRL Y-2460]